MFASDNNAINYGEIFLLSFVLQLWGCFVNKLSSLEKFKNFCFHNLCASNITTAASRKQFLI